jgi:hypothetical protein
MTSIAHIAVRETSLDVSIDRLVDHRAWGHGCPAEGFDVGYRQWQDSSRDFIALPIASILETAARSIGGPPGAWG